MERTSPAETRTQPGTLVTLLGLSLATGGLAGFLILIGERVPAGGVVAVAGLALVVARLRERGSGVPRLAFADSLAERLVEAVVLGALAWEFLPAEPRTGVAALVALSASYVAAYVRAKATGLGFELEESLPVQALRMAGISVGLLAGLEEAGLWAAAAVSLVAAVTLSLDVARREEPA